MAAERLHADDTTVPVLDTGKTRTGRLWTFVRDNRPFADPVPSAAIYFYSPDRGGAHPDTHLAGRQGLLQADPYGGLNRLYERNRQRGADRRVRSLGLAKPSGQLTYAYDRPGLLLSEEATRALSAEDRAQWSST